MPPLLAFLTAYAQAPLHASPGNVMIVILDDVGVDKLGVYGLGTDVPRTPTIDGLAAQGVTFTKAYVNPLCSPTRSAMMTGRRAWRTGVGDVLLRQGPDQPLAEVTLPEMLELGTGRAWDASFAGKWHLSTVQGDYLDHPNLQGFDWYGGLLSALLTGLASDGLPQDHDDWEKTTQGVPARTTTYTTTDTADDAIARMSTMAEPWLLVVSFHAPHFPLHVPPRSLMPSVPPPPPGSGRRQILYNAALEAVDTELGRILAALPGSTTLDTTVLLSGDNGTPESAMESAFLHGKGTVYEGGVRVPLIVTGPEVGVPGSQSDAVVEATDVFATVADLAQVDLQALGLTLDSVSFLPQVQDPTLPGGRTHAVSEYFEESSPGVYTDVRLAVRDERWRLVRVNGVEELYDLGEDQNEGVDLLTGPLDPEASAAYADLTAAVPQHWVSLGY